jgi:hypothetical protein
MMPDCDFHVGVEWILSNVRLPCGRFSGMNISSNLKNDALYCNEDDLIPIWNFKLKIKVLGCV